MRTVRAENSMTKHIFVTGGVVSSLGKGLTASSLGSSFGLGACTWSCRSSIPTSTSIPVQ